MRALAKWCITSTLVIFLGPFPAIAYSVENLLDDDWIHATGNYFEIISNASPDTIRSIAADLERFHYFLPTIAPELKISSYAPPLLVYLFKNRQSYAQINQCEICTGFFFQTPGNNYIAANLENYEDNPGEINTARRYLFHEYVHYAVRNAEIIQHYPLWYEEGLAELLATFLYNDDMIRVGVMREDMWLINFDAPFPVKAVLKRRNAPKNNRAAARYYNHALILYRYFMNGWENHSRLENYVRLLNQGVSIDAAFKKAVARNYADFNQRLNTYLKLVKRAYNQPKFLYQHYKLTTPFTPSAIQVESLTPSRLAFRLGDLLAKRNGDHHQQAEYLFRTSLQSDPGYIPAYLGLSRYALSQNKPYHSLFYLNRALEIAQLNETAEMLTLQGNIFLYLAISAFNQADSAWSDWAKRAQNSYLDALKLSEHFVSAHLGLAYYFVLCDRAQSHYDIEQARHSLELIHKAIRSATVDFFMAKFLLLHGDKQHAQAILKNIIVWQPDSEISKEAGRILNNKQNSK
jgi:hypothetical protein